MIANIEDKKEQRIEIDLAKEEGNAFALIGAAKSLCKVLERDSAPIVERMMSGDYENLIQVFDEEFGDMVILYRAKTTPIRSYMRLSH